MEIGKLKESVLKRSVIKQLHVKRPEVGSGPSIGEDCATLQVGPDEEIVMSTDPITGTASDIGELAVTVSINDLASAGAEPIGILLTILLTPRMREAKLKAIMEQVDNACKRYNVQVMGGHTEVTEVVNQPLISVTAVGKVKKGQMVSTGGAKPGMDLVVTKWIGLEGTSIIAKDHEEELLTRLPKNLVDTAKGFDKYLSVLPESRVAVEHGVAAMHDITEGGIFGALWEMGEASGVGLDVDLKSIPVKQETIEVCEFFGINPYELISSGAMLIATNDGNGLVRKLAEAGVASAIIGKSNSSNDKRVISGDEVRFLEPPKADALYSVPNVERK
ncbi:MAG: hydrogenase maturation factor [Pseudobutyrivibrio ruminis]|uniref:Hydrogenase maturation factor n=1 Tax=Pseudobutyrivibrio ruminis TaxID=46206 RepID=A0A927YMP3_9FIRM|nr:AIR synthase family protein [Pseudobutyrivibrio sp.]MBE5920039.1 hydrogenase maturation factor [Pseudobutyrivibrio ruminis]MBQ6464562.1 AIR synthase family protein [Pseudobutyrivibrio sp.]